MIKEVRTLSKEALRSLCIRADWYTHGTNEGYGNLLSKCHAGMTTEDIENIARDIVGHSDIHSDMDITDVMFSVAEVCITCFCYG